MDAINALALGFQAMFNQPVIFLLLIFGTFFGMVMGAIPGLTATLAVTMALPFTYVLSAYSGLSLLVAIYVGGISGGLIAACLLNIPGSPASLVTCFDGAPMARSGQASKALGLGVFASLIGGLFSAVVLVVVAPALAKVALIFSSWEYFALGVMGLAVIISICSKDMVKGFISAGIGLVLAMVGYDAISSVPRLMFGQWQLGSGMGDLPTLMALFAVVEVMNQVKSIHVKADKLKTEKIHFFPKKEWISGGEKTRTFLLGSVIGTFIGILPGIGQTTASMFSYNTTRSISKNPEKFGTGCEEGVIASETANNAVCGGALIPMLTLGIPGDMTTAILIGGLIMNGLTPGPLLFVNNRDVVGVVFVAFILCCIIMYVMEMGLMNFFIRILSVPMNVLFPIILVMCVVGTLTVHNRLFDSWVLVVIGLIGYLLVNNDFPLPPIVLGYILGPIIEKNFRTGVLSEKGNYLGFVNHPIAVVILAIAVLMIVVPEVNKYLKNKKTAKEIA